MPAQWFPRQFLYCQDKTSCPFWWQSHIARYPQYRKARRLTHECCNYCNGNCLLLDDGEECVCVQSISYSLLCRWFQAAVLPLDAALYAEIIKDRDEVKRCCECGATFQPKSNRAKYCAACAKRMRRRKEAERQRKRYWQHEA